MAHTTIKYLILPWAPDWHLHIPTRSWPYLKDNMYTHIPFDDIHIMIPWSVSMQAILHQLNTIHFTMRFTSHMHKHQIPFWT